MTPTFSRRRFLASTGAVIVGGTGMAGCSKSDAPPGDDRLEFPAEFAFGVATSAYQIEGAASQDGRGRSIWDTFVTQPGKIDDSSSGAVACDHYNRWSTDLDLLDQVGVDSYRFSVSWPRVLPAGRGAVNRRGLDFYKRLVDGLRRRDIKPMATLYHWDLPQRLQDEGGWENRDSAEWFGEYAAAVYSALDGVDSWLTINEPRIIVQQGYQRGWMAPGKSDPVAAGKVVHHLGLAHGRAVQAFRASGRPGSIGPCAVVTPCYPADDSAEAKAMTALADTRENGLYLEPVLKGRYPALDRVVEPAVAASLRASIKAGDLAVISQPVDFVAVNYYSPLVVDGTGTPQERYPVSSAGWQQIHAPGLRDALIGLHRKYGAEIVVAENGLPDDPADQQPGDAARIRFLHDHLVAAHEAIQAGVELRGFHVWSFLDNFEWARGYTQRWGLVHVDFDTQLRTKKDSATWYSEVIAARSVVR